MPRDLETIVVANEERRMGLVLPTVSQLRGHEARALKAGRLWADNKVTYTLDQLRARPVDRRPVFGVDWVKNQRSHGSCNGFSTAAGVQKTRFLRGQARVDLCGASAYAHMNGGRDNGSTLEDGMQVAQKYGVLPETLSSWDKIYLSQYPKDVWAEALRYRVEADEAYVLNSELEVASAILEGYIPIVATQVDSRFEQTDPNGVSRAGPGPGNHSIHFDGYKWCDALGCLVFDNEQSWGTGFGDKGRIWLTWERHLKACRQYGIFWAVRGVIDDPKGDNPPPVAA